MALCGYALLDETRYASGKRMAQGQQRVALASESTTIRVLMVDDQPLRAAGIAGEINVQQDMRVVA